MMHRLHGLAPISRFLVFKTFANSSPSASRLQGAAVAPVRFPFLEILGTRHYSPRRKNGKQNNNGGQKDGGEDAWGRAWDTARFPSETEATETPPWETSEGGDDAWDTAWSTGITEEHFEGGAVGRMVAEGGGGRVPPGEEENEFAGLEKAYKENKKFVDSLDRKKKEWANLLRQVREPGLRGAYLKDSEKAEMYKLHKENPEVYTVEKLAKDYRIMRQRVHAILWLKEIEEEEERKLGHPLDDAVEQLLDTCPEFFDSADREFHVATLPYKPDFKVMPEDWEGTAKDQDEYLWELSQKEDEILYQEFVQRMNFNKMQMAGKVKCHPHSRRRPVEGWSFVVEELGPNAKRGRGGGRKFVSLPDGSSRPLNEMEKMYVRRETVRPRRKIIVTS